jgi:hypothetical protein
MSLSLATADVFTCQRKNVCVQPQRSLRWAVYFKIERFEQLSRLGLSSLFRFYSFRCSRDSFIFVLYLFNGVFHSGNIKFDPSIQNSQLNE